MKQIVIVGGGPAGFTAAIMAARHGAHVLLLERMPRVGKKLLATGNGRCNLANRNLAIIHYHGHRREAIEDVFCQFGLDDTLAFFESLGIPVVEEESGKLFPLCQQASSVLDVLRYEMQQLGVTEICEAEVQSIYPSRGGYACQCANGKTFNAARVILCAGGQASPNLGSNGAGFALAKALGHSIIEPFPALVQVRLDAPFLNQLAGVGFSGKVQVFVDGKPLRTETGDLLFAKYGLSGSAILQISRIVAESTQRGRRVELHLDLFPSHSITELTGIIQERIHRAPHKSAEFSFVGLLHKRLIPVILQKAGVDTRQEIPCSALTRAQIERIASVLKKWIIPTCGTQPWMDAQVTAGGVDFHEVDPATLESLRAPGIHFAGEILDIDGDSGGYNLQWAWSSGAVAGTQAALLAKM